jgi:hypothetical protein
MMGRHKAQAGRTIESPVSESAVSNRRACLDKRGRSGEQWDLLRKRWSRDPDRSRSTVAIIEPDSAFDLPCS